MACPNLVSRYFQVNPLGYLPRNFLLYEGRGESSEVVNEGIDVFRFAARSPVTRKPNTKYKRQTIAPAIGTYPSGRHGNTRTGS